MNKFHLSFFILLITIFLVFGFFTASTVKAASLCDESKEVNGGIVPCGRKITRAYECKGYQTKADLDNDKPSKTWKVTSYDDDTDPYTGNDCSRQAGDAGLGWFRLQTISTSLGCPCELEHIFILILNVYKFILWYIAVPLAGFLIMIGGILLLLGGGYPKLHELGKRVLWGAIWGIILVFGAWLIINIVLRALGYTAKWFILF